MRWTAPLAILFLCTVGMGCGGHAPPTVFPPALPTTLPSGQITYTNPTLDRADALLNHGHRKAARELMVTWLKANPHAPDRDRGIFIMAWYYVEAGNLINAFYQYDELLDNLPDSPLYYRALENQYRIANLLLNGYKMKFLGLRIVGGEDEGIEMLYRLQERSPGSPLSERAMWRTADYYFFSRQFELSYDVYTAYIRTYPRSSLISRAMVRRAFSSLAQFRGVDFDATPLLDARSQFQDISTRYPSVAAEDNLADRVDQIDRVLAAKMLDTARFYAWTGKPGAAVYTYRSLIDLYPNSSQANTARGDLQTLPPWALALKPPPKPQPVDVAAPTLNVPLP